MNVRLLSGDHIETTKFAAVRLGIISTEEAKNDEIVMDSEEFKQ